MAAAAVDADAAYGTGSSSRLSATAQQLAAAESSAAQSRAPRRSSNSCARSAAAPLSATARQAVCELRSLSCIITRRNILHQKSEDGVWRRSCSRDSRKQPATTPHNAQFSWGRGRPGRARMSLPIAPTEVNTPNRAIPSDRMRVRTCYERG